MNADSNASHMAAPFSENSPSSLALPRQEREGSDDTHPQERLASGQNRPVYFDCNMCGECCSSWSIPIEREKAHALMEKDWAQARLRETRRELTPVSETLYRIPLTDENTCVFLADDRRCLIEANEGLALKPYECRRFPFASVKMPDGSTRHDASAACKVISEKLLLAFQPILPRVSNPVESDEAILAAALSWQEQQQFDEAEQLPNRIFSGVFRKVSIAAYQRYQAQLKALFSNPNNSPEMALQQASQFLSKLENNGSTSTIAQQDKPAKNGFHPLISKALLLLFLRKPYRTWSWFSLLEGEKYEDPRIFGLSVNLREVREIHWEARRNHHLNAFLYNLLERKLPLAREQSLSALLAMAAVVCLLVRWYAAVLAWFRESSQIEDSDVSTAIRLVERYYTGHQPRFLHFFQSRWQGKFIEWLLLKI